MPCKLHPSSKKEKNDACRMQHYCAGEPDEGARRRRALIRLPLRRGKPRPAFIVRGLMGTSTRVRLFCCFGASARRVEKHSATLTQSATAAAVARVTAAFSLPIEPASSPAPIKASASSDPGPSADADALLRASFSPATLLAEDTASSPAMCGNAIGKASTGTSSSRRARSRRGPRGLRRCPEAASRWQRLPQSRSHRGQRTRLAPSRSWERTFRSFGAGKMSCGFPQGERKMWPSPSSARTRVLRAPATRSMIDAPTRARATVWPSAMQRTRTVASPPRAAARNPLLVYSSHVSIV